MDTSSAAFTSIDEYIKAYPKDVQERLNKLREVIHKAAPDAIEAIAYGMPTFRQNGNVIHFAAFKNHIGVYPAPSGIEEFAEELKPYAKSKGTIQFQHSEEIPYDLITRITKYRVQENANKKKKY